MHVFGLLKHASGLRVSGAYAAPSTLNPTRDPKRVDWFEAERVSGALCCLVLLLLLLLAGGGEI